MDQRAFAGSLYPKLGRTPAAHKSSSPTPVRHGGETKGPEENRGSTGLPAGPASTRHSGGRGWHRTPSEPLDSVRDEPIYAHSVRCLKQKFGGNGVVPLPRKRNKITGGKGGNPRVKWDLERCRNFRARGIASRRRQEVFCAPVYFE